MTIIDLEILPAAQKHSVLPFPVTLPLLLPVVITVLASKNIAFLLKISFGLLHKYNYFIAVVICLWFFCLLNSIMFGKFIDIFKYNYS